MIRISNSIENASLFSPDNKKKCSNCWWIFTHTCDKLLFYFGRNWWQITMSCEGFTERFYIIFVFLLLFFVHNFVLPIKQRTNQKISFDYHWWKFLKISHSNNKRPLYFESTEQIFTINTLKYSLLWNHLEESNTIVILSIQIDPNASSFFIYSRFIRTQPKLWRKSRRKTKSLFEQIVPLTWHFIETFVFFFSFIVIKSKLKHRHSQTQTLKYKQTHLHSMKIK